MRRSMPAAQPAGSGVTPTFVWRVFCQWWKWVLPAGVLLAALAGAVVWFTWVPKYEAAALVKIESHAPFIAFEKGAFPSDSDLYVQTQIELLRGPVVLAPVLGRPEIATIADLKKQVDPLKYLQKKLSVGQVGKSELYRVSFESHAAKDAASVANAVVAEYLRMQDAEERQRSQVVIEVLEKDRLERGALVEQLRNRVLELSKALTGKDPFGQGIITDDKAFTPGAAMYQTLVEADVSLSVLKAELQSLQSAPILAADKSTAAGLLELEISNRPDVRQLKEYLDQVEQAKLEVQNKRRSRIGDSWDKDPEYKRLGDVATKTQAELKSLMELARKELVEQNLNHLKVEQEQRIEAKLQEIASLSTRREILSKKFSEHLNDLKSGGAQSAELEFAKAELEREEKVFELIAARKLALQTEMRAPARVSLMQPANVPSVPLELAPFKQLLLACALALLAPLGIALAHELIVRRVSDAEQLQQETTLPLLGEVARFPVRYVNAHQQALPPARRRELHVYAESIDSLRTNLRLTENVGVPGHKKVIAVCSAASGEGKTSVATALAMSISQATRQPTLVLDADLRDPDVTNSFAVPQHPGVAEVLSGASSSENAIHRVGNTYTYVMPAGKCRANPHHLLHGPAVDDLLKELREQFVTIVIDTPPILAASESLIYAKAADLVVVCSLAEVSRVRQVQSAVARLYATGANVAGAVLSGVTTDRYAYHYGVYGAQPELR